MMGRYWWYIHDAGWPWWGMGLQMLLWILLAMVFVWFLVRLFKKPDVPTKSDDPLSVLKMRLAKGEITKEEFQEMKELLK